MHISGLLYTFYGMAIMFQLMMTWLFCYQRITRSRRSLCVLSFLLLLKYVKDLFFVPLMSESGAPLTSFVNVYDVLLLPFYIRAVFSCLNYHTVDATRLISYVAPYLLCVVMYAISPTGRFYFLLLAICSIYAVLTLVFSLRLCRGCSATTVSLYAVQMAMLVFWFFEIFIPGTLTDCLFMSLSIAGMFASYILLNSREDAEEGDVPVVERTSNGVDMQEPLEPALNTEDEPLPQSADEPDGEDASMNDDERVKELSERLEREFRDNRIYLDPNLRLSTLAHAMCTNRTYLSKFFNQIKGQSFYDFVNAYRLEYSVQLIKTTDYTFDIIATMSGFNSLSTYRRAFQQTYGCSPRQYREGKIPPPVSKGQ